MNLLPTQPDDDPALIAFIEGIVCQVIQHQSPKELYLIRLDGWFNFKWLEFSGKTHGALGVWRAKLTLPPFHPHRVTNEVCAKVICTAPLQLRLKPHKPLHREQASQENLFNWLSKVSTSGLFLWYSGASQSSGRASLMVYQITNAVAEGWYVQFQKDESWQPRMSRGLPQKMLRSLIEMPFDQPKPFQPYENLNNESLPIDTRVWPSPPKPARKSTSTSTAS